MATATNDPTPQPQIITADLNQLSDLIAASVAKAMAALLPQSQGLDSAQLGSVIGNAVAEGISKTERKRVTFGAYIRRGGLSPFHPKPLAETPHLLHKTWQNGYYCQESTLHDVEIELINTITHSGRYCERLVEVIVNNEGQPDQTIDIRFNNTVNAMAELNGAVGYSKKRHVSVFHAMLCQIAEDQQVERAEKDAQNKRLMEKNTRPGQGHMGGSKAYREAVERAAAKEAAEA